jgi:hypothetical protein
MLYFAYGGDMVERAMRKVCPTARYMSLATLAHHQLVFTRLSVNLGGGVADIKEQPGAAVEGVLWELDPREAQALDEVMGYPRERVKREITVTVPGRGPTGAIAYYAIPEGDYRPSKRYKVQLLKAAKELGFSAAYTSFLEGLVTVD